MGGHERGDEGEVSLRRRIMADSETVPVESAVLREMDRHHVEESCVDQERPPQDVVIVLEFDLRDNVGEGPTPRQVTRRLVLVPVSSAAPRPKKRAKNTSEGFHFPIHNCSSGDPSDIG